MGREVKEIVAEESAQVGRRKVGVQVRKVRIEPKSGGPFTVVDVNIAVDKFTFFMSVPEASAVVEKMSQLLPAAVEADRKQKDWESQKKREREMYRPGGSAPDRGRRR